MMGHPEMVKEVKKEDLGPLIPPERLEQLQSKYVQSVQVNRSTHLQLLTSYKSV